MFLEQFNSRLVGTKQDELAKCIKICDFACLGVPVVDDLIVDQVHEGGSRLRTVLRNHHVLHGDTIDD